MNLVVIPRAQHTLSRKLIDPDALKVMYRLLKAGHRALLVGGGVRDLLLGRTPKDFDLATDAHPNQIKSLFRNCRLVGRRFRLAHVHFGDKIIEVSTFRRRSEYEEGEEDQDRMIRSDNTFGTAEEDALRRDFTINGLFYDLETFSVLDYVGGIEDLENRVIRSIGDPDARIPEDPVRILRAVKFAARLGFTVEDQLWQSMIRFAPDIHKCAKPRVLEEIYRLLRGGSAMHAFNLLDECGLMTELLPEVRQYLATTPARRPEDVPLWQYLNALDQLRAEGEDLPNPLILGALAVHLLDLAVGQPESDDESDSDLPLAQRIDALTWEWVSRLGVARRDRERLGHMLRAQPRFTRTRGRRFRPRSFVTKHYYPDAEALFALGCRATGMELETLSKWKQLRDEVGGPTEEAPRPASKRSGRRRRRRRPRGADETAAPEATSPRPPRKTRRRPRRRATES